MEGHQAGGWSSFGPKPTPSLRSCKSGFFTGGGGASIPPVANLVLDVTPTICRGISVFIWYFILVPISSVGVTAG